MISPLSDDYLTLHYRPMAWCGGAVMGLETLMRWHHRSRRPVSSGAFVPVFEKSSLIVPISLWALATACTEAAGWEHAPNVIVNFAAALFELDTLVAEVESALGASGLAPERLEIDITESALLGTPDKTLRAMERLRAMGIQFGLDDFGAGTSSPSFIRDYPFSRLKLDWSVTASLAASASARSIVGMTTDLAHAQGMTVVADGIETHEQLDIARELGCDLSQGFLTGRAGPIEGFPEITGVRRSAALRDSGDPEAMPPDCVPVPRLDTLLA